ncbi:MAG: tetratricopeptide repeat protein [Burkholderiales bacterium]|jgi:tetratricopeptide (TPR) repeat protein
MNHLPSCALVLCILAIHPSSGWSTEVADPKSKARATESISAKETVADPASPTPSGNKTSPTLSAEQLLYQYLLSEIAGQRGRPVVASRGMLDLAQKTSDPRIARRAAEIAFQSRQTPEAREALLLWITLEPESATARQALGALVGIQGPIEQAAETLSQWLQDKTLAPALFLQMPYLLGRYSDRDQVANLVAELALPYGAVPEAQFALGITAYAAGRLDAALASIEAAISSKPSFSRAVIARAQMIRAADDDEAAERASRYLAGYLKAFPRDTEVRVAYARSLVSTKSLLPAREEFRRASRELPRDGELVYASALISLQIEDWNAAIVDLKRTLDMDPRDKNPVYFNLGLAAEGQKDIDAASAWYRLVGEGEYFVNAKLRAAGFVAKRDGIEAGRKLLQNAQNADLESPESRTQLVLAEAQLLRDNGAIQEAYDVLSAALAKQPESVPLRYDRAMVADRLNRLADMESDLRIVIRIKPDHAHAYNALGYALAERNIRLPEALGLIRKSISLAPEDAFILDSLGWVQYRMQQIENALATLRRAYRIRPDPEIAAHLGEVLWVSGKKDDAQQLWQRALLENPDNATLIAVIERFKQ